MTNLHVQKPHETRKVAVLEVSRKHLSSKRFGVTYGEGSAGRAPRDQISMGIVFKHTTHTVDRKEE